jgi:hypothetical protein
VHNVNFIAEKATMFAFCCRIIGVYYIYVQKETCNKIEMLLQKCREFLVVKVYNLFFHLLCM